MFYAKLYRVPYQCLYRASIAAPLVLHDLQQAKDLILIQENALFGYLNRMNELYMPVIVSLI